MPYEAAGSRQALARFRGDMIQHALGGGISLREAAVVVRMQRPFILAGPFTTGQVIEWETRWAWSWAMCDLHSLGGGIQFEPSDAATRAEAVQVLGEDRAASIERDIAVRYTAP